MDSPDTAADKKKSGAVSKATIIGHHDGFVKVVADEQYGEILGVHIIGPSAYELIAEAVAAMEAEATVETIIDGCTLYGSTKTMLDKLRA